MSGTAKNKSHSSVPLFRFLGKRNPIGVDMGDDILKLAQLENNNEKGIKLLAGGSRSRPKDVVTGSISWQKWAIDSISELTANGEFKGREVIAALPASEVFIDHVKMPKIKNDKPAGNTEAALSRMKHKLPFEADDAMIKYIPTEQENVLVIAVERTKIDRYLAIYEKAKLQIKSIDVWPAALANSYTSFFGRRKTDVETDVMLVDIESSRTNTVICRHKNLLFARSIPIGRCRLETDEAITRLVLELTACRRQFGSMYKRGQIGRLIFLSGLDADKEICKTIAKKMEIPAQMGDCLAAVQITNSKECGVERRKSPSTEMTSVQEQGQSGWATAFGLSLS